MSGAHVFIDHSQFPENAGRDLLISLEARAINHKFHYESYKQAAKWLALHEAYSPARNNTSCTDSYDAAFQSTVITARQDQRSIHVIGLGCGGGKKEARLLEILGTSGRKVRYTPSDVSLPLVLAARSVAVPFLHEPECRAVVCDLATADLNAIFENREWEDQRIVTLFGIMPNFEPAPLLSKITNLLSPDDLLLVSANLAPGSDYATGVRAIVPQYDNELTRDWLYTFLFDVGFEREDGELNFTTESDERQLLRITAYFELKHSRDIRVLSHRILFHRGERIRVFFSYRHTPHTIRSLMGEYCMTVEGEWLNDTGEEGVFLCRKAA